MTFGKGFERKMKSDSEATELSTTADERDRLRETPDEVSVVERKIRERQLSRVPTSVSRERCG